MKLVHCWDKPGRLHIEMRYTECPFDRVREHGSSRLI